MAAAAMSAPATVVATPTVEAATTVVAPRRRGSRPNPRGHTILGHPIHSRPGNPNCRQSKSNRHSNPSNPVSNSNPGLGPPESLDRVPAAVLGLLEPSQGQQVAAAGWRHTALAGSGSAANCRGSTSPR